MADKGDIDTPGILVVAQDELVLSLLGHLFRQTKHQVWQASSGPQALELFRQHHRGIAAVVLDVRMIGSAGPRRLAITKGLESLIRFCFMIGSNRSCTDDELYKLGAKAVFRSPFDVSEIAKGIRQFVRGLRLEPESPGFSYEHLTRAVLC